MNGYLRIILMVVGFIISFHLPYGEKTPYWLKFIVGCCFALPSLLLGFTAWQIIIPLSFIIMFWLSNTKFGANIFRWKVVEFLTGVLIGVSVSIFLRNEWLMIVSMACGGTCFAIGGTGFKWVRRFILPIIFGAIVLINYLKF